MKLTIDKKISLVILFSLVFGFIILGFATKVKANPLGFIRDQSASATTTRVFLVPASTSLGTTTLTVDTGRAGASAQGGESGVLLVQITASSSASTLLINQEYSQDGIDWYQGTQGLINIGLATSTNNPIGFDLAVVPQYSYRYASSTIGGISPASTTNTVQLALPFFTPTRFTRFVFSPRNVANGNMSIWAESVIKKQNP